MGKVIAVCTSATHTLQKPNQGEAKLIKGLGFESDAHQGVTVKHRSRVKKDPTVANLRQVHLIHAELHDELNAKGFSIAPGEMGENLTTRGIDLMNLPKDSILHIGKEAKVQLKGLRNPCYQLDTIQKGLMKAVLDKSDDGELTRKAGVMGIALASGVIAVDDEIRIELPAEPFVKMEKV